MKIELCPNIKKDPELIYTKKIIEILKDCGAEIFVNNDIPHLDEVSRQICQNPDMIVVLGGDGSIMKAGRYGAVKGVPVLGINLGRVGYLAELSPDDADGIRAVMNNEYYIEKRMMLEVSALRNGKDEGTSMLAINDVVLSHGKVSHLLETEVICDGSSLGHYRSDGFIVSTPTGSTAYSLSAGGPVLSPKLKGICLTPICPHSLCARPIIVPEDSVIEIKYVSPQKSRSHLTVDGNEAAELVPGDCIKVVSSSRCAEFVRVYKNKDKSFYDILREKMSLI